MDIEEVKDFIRKQSPETKIYLGADSERLKVDGVENKTLTVGDPADIITNHVG